MKPLGYARSPVTPITCVATITMAIATGLFAESANAEDDADDEKKTI
jgi:hypothetical protein